MSQIQLPAPWYKRKLRDTSRARSCCLGCAEPTPRYQSTSACFCFSALQLSAMYLEDARLLAIRETLIAKARRIVTLKKGVVLAFMTAQFGTLGTAGPINQRQQSS